MRGSVTLAIGRYELAYDLEFSDYRETDVSTRIRAGGEPQ
jgi:hypothetical protein